VALALINAYFGWQQTGLIRLAWLGAAAVVILKSVATYAYFAPVMIGRLEQADFMDAAEVTETVKQWTVLSPLRLGVELFAWIAAVSALVLLGWR